jgi:hypothetical protein
MGIPAVEAIGLITTTKTGGAIGTGREIAETAMTAADATTARGTMAGTEIGNGTTDGTARAQGTGETAGARVPRAAIVATIGVRETGTGRETEATGGERRTGQSHSGSAGIGV